MLYQLSYRLQPFFENTIRQAWNAPGMRALRCNEVLSSQTLGYLIGYRHLQLRLACTKVALQRLIDGSMADSSLKALHGKVCK